MKKMLKLLIVLTISLSLSGCAWFANPKPPEPIIKIEHVYHYTPCAKDDPPNYVQLLPNKHIGSAENINILIGNLEVQKDYGQSLNTTIECYEKQIKNSEISNENR
jgi:hypothetical protein